MFILYDEGCYARHIARELRTERFYPSSGKHRVPKDWKKNPRRRLSVDVNWGCGPRKLALAARLRHNERVLNADISASVLKMNTFDRIDAWNRAHEVDGSNINHPFVTRDLDEIVEKGKYLARKDGLSGGAGIDIFERGQRPADPKQYDFYSLVVAKACEVRIHVAGGQVICEQVKYVPKGEGVLIRNYDNGARFSNKNIENALPKGAADIAREMAIDTAEALGLDFGAVDVMMSQRGRIYVLEFNSAPGITPGEDENAPKWDQPPTFNAYLEYFRGLLV